MRSVELDVSSEWTSRYSSQRIDIVTPGRFSSRARADQSGSARRRWPCVTPARPNSRVSSASSVTSSASGHASPAAAARFRLSWIVERATPRRRPISRALTPSWCSRNRCRSCRMLSSRFAGIPISSSTIDGPGVPQLANRGEQTTRAVTGSGGRLHFGMVAGIKSERWPSSNRNAWPECVGIRTEEGRAHLAVLEGEVEQGLENLRHGARNALLALLAAGPIRAALDHVEGVQDPRVGVAVDPELGGGEKRALAPVVDEVWPLGHGLVVQALDEGALLVAAGLAHEVGRGAAEVLLPPRRAVGAARRFNPRGGGRAGAFRLGEQAGLFRRQMLKRHAFSFGLQDNPPEGARTISGKAPQRPKKGACVGSCFRGVSRLPHLRYSPALPGHRPALLAGFVFLGFDSSVHQTGRESPDSARVALFACHVNAMSR